MRGNSTEMQSRRHCDQADRRRAERRDERKYPAHHMEFSENNNYRYKDRKVYGRDADEQAIKSRKEDRFNSKDYHDSKSLRREKNYRHISPFLSRREGIHRNSPVELVVKGCRNTDSSSSDAESDRSDHKSYHHRQHKRKHNEEESYEELSRRKKRIESELSALLAEEEEEKHHFRAEKKKFSRSCTTPRKETFSEKKPEIKMEHRIKQERMSDEERDNRHSRKGSPKRSSEKMEWGKKSSSDPKKVVKEKEKPNFGASGKLAEDTNIFNGVVIKYNEPKEARKPKRRWRLYPFKGDTPLEFLPIHRQSAYLFGRSRLIADIPIDHPSCSKQHAVLQYRLVNYTREDGTTGRRLRPYIIDLESSNGTFVNNKQVDPRRYVELLEKDVIKFGYSTREYVILHEESRDESLDDDYKEESEGSD